LTEIQELEVDEGAYVF